ncbi:hypothetical protein [Streptococcus massiliensis]|uniref:Cystathionine beta-lyase n=1 Tax=Streptococcus massiliensis TaxID=313439 RepID=A0A380KW05_9STRE|nr:hypothetical protein [Streptococcus massiliensis]SUN75721.1 cystathionine beta-lyase [Streptococcus massiliensis]
MTDYLDLALKYGGFTSLDKVYLTRVLAELTEAQKLTFITPPPSVINAYFAELYQKKSPEAATDYFFELSRKLSLFNDRPTFEETKPFVRLNLSGKAFGYCYVAENELARVFAQEKVEITADLLFEIAQIFPHYQVYEKAGKIYMEPAPAEEVVDRQSLTALTDLEILTDSRKKLSGYNQEELLDLAQNYAGKKAFRSQNRTAMIYIE